MFHTTFFSQFFKRTTLVFLLAGTTSPTSAKEGMWLPARLEARAADLKASGLDIPVQMLYNEAGTGLNNNIVLFGRGCTGEVISPKGLLLTNHHCGYGTVQGLSSIENDYFATGFFAQSQKDEIPCPGLTVTFVRKMENVTGHILSGIADTLDVQLRKETIQQRIKNLEKGYRYTSGLDAAIKPFYEGNQYWVILTETYLDIRLVAFPPNGIGKFGGNTDNWMWPRHTGDFGIFRIYAGKDNKPAAYNPANKPYRTKNFFTLNIGGYDEEDFTMVYGFPGNTNEYISSYQLDQIISINLPSRIDVRSGILDIWNKHMESSREVFLKYTSKHARLANGWKKWQGVIHGLQLNDAISLKKNDEMDFQAWASGNQDLPYASDLLAHMLVQVRSSDSALKADVYIQEALMGIELIDQNEKLNRILSILRSPMSIQKIQDSIGKIADGMKSFYKNYDLPTDRDVFQAMMERYLQNASMVVPSIRANYEQYQEDVKAWSADVYRASLLANQEKFQKFAHSVVPADTIKILADPAWRLYHEIMAHRDGTIKPLLNRYRQNMNRLNRLYMKAQMEKEGRENLYPDANLTLRLTYGKVMGLSPKGSSQYSFQTTLDGVIAKQDPRVEEFRIPEKLIRLYAKKDYGRWAENGTVPVNFIATNHTSGGNSGSPVLNSRGELIGINFDRAWEGTMSDYYFDPKLCRNISVDIRYILFILEKYGDAGWLLKEMRLVK